MISERRIRCGRPLSSVLSKHGSRGALDMDGTSIFGMNSRITSTRFIGKVEDFFSWTCPSALSSNLQDSSQGHRSRRPARSRR